jgi:hypothetical protein
MSKMNTKPSQEEAKRLAALIAEAKTAKVETKSAKLDKFRDVLIRERKAGAKVREITAAVVKLGIDVSEETVRLWYKANEVAPPATSTPVKPIKKSLSASVTPKGNLPVPPPPTRGPRVARDDI